MMENSNNSQHISHKFDQEMESLRNQVLKMGGLVEQQIAGAIESLQSVNAAGAEEIILRDHKVNALEVTIDESCTQILARRQPAASDLRMVVAVIKTITDLERIGDEAEKIAKMALNLAEDDAGFSSRYSGITHLGDHVRQMVHDVLDAYARQDVDAAIKVVRSDDKADEEYQNLMRLLITFMMEDPRRISEVLDVVWAARALERIGDHAKNIGEYVIYLVKGKDIRHLDLDEVEKDILS
ncbi:MAG: phosphate transport system regulatory protein PhoU [endosymbiont of Galathealinum brachiosum]|uniref:Phosphate-specific transport system accessory protein PhoU n=1 Tax=endosymbiont of Galathealinum brachiosum TaxID=2200906 RepID=A0A370DG69_9GAMM|nr:MAG: phosphate transport system regulatory protein PhoU [endosymbiont of Galathealinum brachiosum]